MTDQPKTEFEINGDSILTKLKDLFDKSIKYKLVFKDKDGKQLFDFPLLLALIFIIIFPPVLLIALIFIIFTQTSVSLVK